MLLKVLKEMKEQQFLSLLNQKIVNILNDTDNESSKFATWKWYVINNQNNIEYGEGNKNNSSIKTNDCDWNRTYNNLVCKQTLNHLAKLTKWLNWVVSTYLYVEFDCMFLLCHVRVSEWIHTN